MAMPASFHALRLGAEHIPDKAFEKIPFAGPRYFKEKEDKHETRHEKKKERRRRARDDESEQSDSYSESDYDPSPRSSRAHRSHRRSDRRDRRDDRRDRGYDSDNASRFVPAETFREAPYFPPPPKIAVDDPTGAPLDIGAEEASMQAPYGQAYGDRPQSENSYYNGPPPDQVYSPPPGPPPGHQASRGMPGAAYSDSDRHSSVADRYRPAGYDQNYNQPPGSYDQYNRNSNPNTQNRGSPNPQYPSAMTLHPDPYNQYQPPYNTYQPQEEEWTDSEEEDRRRRRRSRSGSRHSKKDKDRSQSRMGDVTTKAKDGLEKHKKELGVSALGALAGGIIGNEFGGKKGKMGILIGAAIGGLGGGLYEKKSEEKKARQKLERRNSRRQSRDGYESY